MMKGGPAPNDTLMIKGLPMESTDDSIWGVFGQYGSVKSCKVLPPAAGKPARAAFVVMSSVEEATWLVENVNGNMPQGLTTPVEIIYATPREERQGGKGKDGGWGGGDGGWGGGGGGPYGGGMKGGGGGWGGDGGGKAWGGGGGGWGGDGGCKGGGGFGGGASFGGGKGKSPTGAAPNETLMIKGLPMEATDDSVWAIFAQYGGVKDCKVLPPAAGKPLKAGFVTMNTVDEAKWLVENVNGNIPQGMSVPLQIIFADKREDRKGAKGGGGGWDGGKGGAPAWDGGGAWGGAPAWDGGKGGAKGW